MDSALLREREAFKRRAMALPTVENKKFKGSKGSSDKTPSKSSGSNKEQGGSAKAKLDLAHIKSMGGSSSQYKFGVLHKIVRYE